MLHHIVKLKEVGYGGVLKAVDSELVTKEFKKTQSFTMRNRTIPVCRYEICVHLSWTILAIFLNRYLLWSSGRGKVASAHHACKSLVRARCSLKHLLSRAGNELAQEEPLRSRHHFSNFTNFAKPTASNCCVAQLFFLACNLADRKETHETQGFAVYSLQYTEAAKCNEAQTFCYSVRS